MAEPKIAIDILINCQSATNQLKKFNKELNNTVEGGKKASNWLSKGFGRLIGAYFSVRTAQNIFNTGRQMQLLERSITGLTKSTQDWEYIKKTAYDTGNSLDVVARGYKNFYAAASMAGFGKGQIQGMYSDMVMATRAIGASSEQTGGALLALEQMISKGTVSMEELRRQLGNAVPGAFEIGAKAMKMTTKEFNQFVKTGKLASSVFVPLFIAEFKKQYADGFKEIAQTVDFASGRLKESWQELTFEIMQGDIGKNLAQIINEITRFLRSQELKRTIYYLSIIFKWTVKIITFLLENLPLIITLLGTRLFFSIMANATAVGILSMGFKEATFAAALFGKTAILNCLRVGKTAVLAFVSANGAALEFIATLASIILPLLFIEDILVGILHLMGLTNKHSVIGDNWDFAKQMKKESLNIPDFVKDDPKLYKQFKNALKSGDTQFIKDVMQAKGMPTYMSAAPSNLPSMYAKNDTSSNSVTIGDINVNVKSNSDPKQIGLAVQNAFANLFVSQNYSRIKVTGGNY